MMAIAYYDSLFDTNTKYRCHWYENREAWEIGRNELHGIGGSDSSAALSKNKWRNNRELWQIKTGRKPVPDISKNHAVWYGSMCEEFIRRQYQLDVFGKYKVHYVENMILESQEYPYMLYSPDGLLEEKNTGRVGVLEIKTSTIHGDGDHWKNRIPQSYYIQVLHGMAVTGADFAELRASLKYSDEFSMLRTYHIEREDVEQDIDYVIKKVGEFWRYVENDEEPPLIINGI